MKLMELFSSNFEGSWRISGDSAACEFEVEGVEYVVDAEIVTPQFPPASEFQFPVLQPNTEIWVTSFGTADDQYGITNSGNASAVFGKVVNALKLFKQQRPRAVLFFTAHEPSRQRLYQAMAARLSRNYLVLKPMDPSDTDKGYLVY